MRAVLGILAMSGLLALAANDGLAIRKRPVRAPIPPPHITSIVPTSGPIAGGTRLTINGSGLFPGGGVSVDGEPVTEVTFHGGSQITFATPPHDNGYAVIAIATAQGRATAEFLYVPPALSELQPGGITTVAGIGFYLGEGRDGRQVPVKMSDFAIAPDGTAYLAEAGHAMIRRVTPEGTIERFAGVGPELLDLGPPLGDEGPALEAALNAPTDAKIGPDGALYVVDTQNQRIRRIDLTTSVVTTVVGSGPIACVECGTYAGDDGFATAARLNSPNQIAFDAAGSMYILDVWNARVRKVSGGIITTVAGNGIKGFSGDGGPAVDARIDPGANYDYGALKVDASGNIFIAEHGNRLVRRVDAGTGIIDTVLGGGNEIDDGVGAREVRLPELFGIALDTERRLYFTDYGRIRRVESDGKVRTLLGAAPHETGFSEDGTALSEARLTAPLRMHVQPGGDLYFMEFNGKRLRKIPLSGTGVLTTIAGIEPYAVGENGPGTAALLDLDMHQAVIDPSGELIFGGSMRIRRLKRDGTVKTIPGGYPSFGIAVDKSGRVLVSDWGVGRIESDGNYTQLTQWDRGFSGDGGPASAAMLDNAQALAVDSKGNIFVADSYNHRIRRIDAVTGIITTVAGTAPAHPPDALVPNRSSGDGGPAIAAEMNSPVWIAVDALDRIYVADTDRIRRIDDDGIIRTVVSSCLGALGTNLRGEVFVFCNSEVRRIDGIEQWTRLARFGAPQHGGDGLSTDDAGIGFVGGLAVDDAGIVYLIDAASLRVRAVRPR
ncbi:MAG: IPT/TIG domain-containing protein [Acidobacteria bacterium]|nr:IPT/TIG domain-containing protein [Acidobacteriota bacterium]